MGLTVGFWSRPQRTASAIVALVMGAVGFLPLFGGPGYEHALATGLIAPSAAAIATALDGARDRAASPLAAVGRGLLSGLTMAAVSLATALAHGARVGICDLMGGLTTFALTAGIGAILGGVWGALVGEAAARRSRPRLVAVTGALAGPLACVALGVWRFYATPIVYAFDPFVGYFSGTLYDTVIDAGTPLLTYRAGSALALVGVTFAASVLARGKDGRLRALSWRGRSDVAVRGVVGALGLAGALAVAAEAQALGHWHSSERIAEVLGGARDGPRCSVRYPLGTRDEDADLLLKDCEDDLASVEKVLGARGPERITAFFFRDAGEKKRLMGAADTYIAKPWRKEVYLQMHGYPHPVLGHELAHVVAGSFARGPFKVAGDWGGLWPNPGLIEGIAVAASPDDDELSDGEWARAMMDQGILPDVRAIFGVGFLGASAAKSYTIAGAFVRFVMDTFGAETARAWYAGAELPELTRATWPELDARFRRELAKYTLSPEAAAVAKAKFDRPSVFGRTCPHVVDAIRREGDGCRDQGQYDRAVRAYGQALERDPHDVASRFARATVELRFGDAARGRAELVRFAGEESVPRTWRDKGDEALADADYVEGRYDEAADRYLRVAARSLDEDLVRNLEVKALAARDPDARAAVQALLLGERRRPTDPFVGAVLLGEWSAATKSPLASYLIGKNLAGRGFFARAAAALDRALAEPLPLASVAREALRQRVVCACALRDSAALDRARRAIADPSGPFRGSAGGRRASALALADRCAVVAPPRGE